MNSSYLFEQETMSRNTINLGSTYHWPLWAIILFSLIFFGLAGCFEGKKKVESSTGNPTDNMEVTPPPSGGRPDLIIQSNSVSDTTLTPGQRFTLFVTVRNQGNGRAPATTLRYKTHAFLPIRTDDPTVGTDSVASLDPSRTSSESIILTAPSRPDTYHYGACVDSVSGEASTTNNCSGNQGVEVTVREESGGGSGPGSGGGNGGSPRFGGKVVEPSAFADECVRHRRLSGGFNVADVEVRNSCNVKIEVTVACPIEGYAANYPFRGVYSFTSAGRYNLPPNSGWRPDVNTDLCERNGGRGRTIACVSPADPYFVSPTGDRYTCLVDP